MNDSTNDVKISEGSKAPKRPARYRNSGGRSKVKANTTVDTDQSASTDREDMVDKSSPVIQEFQKYQVLLDTRHDKYERMVKKSRDVTVESKRVIFLLHRITKDTDSTAILKEAAEKLCFIRNTHLKNIAKELQDEDPFQFLRAISPGLQEYVEAVTFYHYRKDESIVPLAEVEKDLLFKEQDAEAANLFLPPAEYMLGLADLTGELMRLGINSVAQGNLETPFKLSLVLKNLYEGFNSLGMAGKEIGRKTKVLRQSLQKVEHACYNINVRGSEIPKHMLTDVFVTEPTSPSRQAQAEIF